jgi:hypothetical protein
MEFRRRQFLTEPGESLLLPLRAMEIVERLFTITRESGLSKEQIVTSSLVSIPLFRRNAGQRWSPETEPSLFWHPLLWLPERLAYPNAGVRADVWAISVALEMTVAGLYDVESGTWVDILATVGLDSEDVVTQARITEWLEGASDPELDAINLSAGLDIPDDLSWSLAEAEELLPLLVPASWAVLSNDLIATASDALEDADPNDIPALADQARAILYVAQGSIGDGPAGIDGEESPSQVWARVLSELHIWPSQPLEAIVDGPFDQVIESLYSIRNDYWVFVEALWETQNGGSPDGAAAAA